MSFSHHAYLIEGALSLFAAYRNDMQLAEHLEARDPNFIARSYEKFGIEDARELIQLSALKHAGARAVFFIGTGSMTSEAQQALLKLFEEPQLGTLFVLLVPEGTLMPTLRSRMLAYPRQLEQGLGTAAAKEFLASPYKKRSDWIATLLKTEEGARETVRTFLNELEAELYTKRGEKEFRDALSEIAHFRQYLSDRAPSLKMILEHFAATLPVLPV